MKTRGLLVQLHHRSRGREAPAHVSHLPSALSLALWLDITSFSPCGCHIERSHISGGFFFFVVVFANTCRFVSSLRLDCETTTQC